MSLPSSEIASQPPSQPLRIDVHPGLVGKSSVRVIAVWEAIKGVLVLLAGGLAVYIFRPDDEHTIETFVAHFHLNPAGHTSHIFQRALEHLQDTRLVLLASGALAYALLRFVEAYGLWFEKRWGWILGIASAGLYLPFEVREMAVRFTWTSVALFVVNMAIVALLWRNRTRHVVVIEDAVTRRPFVDLRPVSGARGTVRVPGSKSISIRALLLAALADGETVVYGVLRSDDTTVMIDALRTLGVLVDELDASTLRIRGSATLSTRDADVFVGNSGLSIRTLTAALAFSGGRYRLSGVARMHERPIGDLAHSLTDAGARIAYEARPGFPPLIVEPSMLHPPDDGRRRLRVDATASSQFLTGLLQAAPMLARDADLSLDVDGALISRPYVDLTIALMRRFGVDVVERPGPSFEVARGAHYVSPGTFSVEGDASSAACLLAAGLLGGGPVRVDGIGRGSLQGDARFVDVLVAMGAQIVQTDEATEVRSPGAAFSRARHFRLRAIDADFNDIPDAAMTVAVLALFADAPCTLRNIGSWRVKETDRLAAMATELARFGATVETGPDWLRVSPLSNAAEARLVEHAVRGEPITVSTYDDHRIAMCFSLTRFLGVPVRIEDPDCVAKTFPDYFERFEALVVAMPVHADA